MIQKILHNTWINSEMLICQLSIMKIFFFFNDTATTEIYTRSIVGSVRCVQETGINAEYMGGRGNLMSKRIFSILVILFIFEGSIQCTEKSEHIKFFSKVAYAEECTATLKSIYISGKADIDFKTDVFKYSVDVPDDDEDILIKAKPTYNNDKVYVNGEPVLKDNNYRAVVDLKYGKNVINIDVKDCIDGTIVNYVIYAYRGGSESIMLDDINIEDRNIGFEESKRLYNIELDKDDDLIRLNVVPKAGNYSVKVNEKLLSESNSIKLKFSGINKYTVNITLIDNDTQKESKYVLNFYLGIPISPDVEGSIKNVLKPNQWILQNGRWRYNNSEGKYLRDTWLYDNRYKRYFYLNSRGYMQTGWYTHDDGNTCLLYTSPSPRDLSTSRMPSSA
eukprot:TRINITY_DN2225_c0_g1_i3.p1 TRINITY_DN2225_c0_g1~~TRINITY_DN2225_c0_g1_i3.p1  ORF type:complete len:391 (-),score=61.79 TRINITY_DN2225_c0_g1_i3:109-1281(-)